MSKYTFDEFVSNAEEFVEKYKNNMIKDVKGHSLEEWVDYGIVGWDDNISSYFIQLDFNQYEP
tara:strand:+ start:405 stop:593 length:189 start_codon:yes stop_codon:yes gene_type:complete